MRLVFLMLLLPLLLPGVSSGQELNSALPPSRLAFGPYATQKFVTATYPLAPDRLYVRLLDNPQYSTGPTVEARPRGELLGGIERNRRKNGLDGNGDPIKETLRIFRFEYGPAKLVFHAPFKYVYEPTLPESVWVAALDSTSLVEGAIGIDPSNPPNPPTDLSRLDYSKMTVWKYRDNKLIWNGKYGAISFTTDDGNDENYDTYRDVFKEFDWRYTLFLNYGLLGLSGKITKAETVTMESEGFEIGAHTYSHWAMDQYDNPKFRYWHPVSFTLGLFDADSLMFNMAADQLWRETGVRDTVGVWADSAYARPVGAVGKKYWRQTATVSRKPIFRRNVQNGLPGVEWEGGSVLDKNFYLAGSTTYPDSTTYPGGNYSIWFVIDPDTLTEGNPALVLLDASTANNRHICQLRDNATGRYRAFTLSGGAATWSELPHAGPQILCYKFIKGTGYELYRNGKKLTLAAGGTSYPGDDFTIGGPVSNTILGTDVSLASGFDGYMFEVVALHQNAPLELQQKIDGYLAHKWALEDSLDFTHPYKKQPPVFPSYGIQQLYTELYGNKTLLEELVNYDGGNWKNRNYRCDVFAYAGGGSRGTDEFQVASTMAGFLGARATGLSSADSLAGYRQLAYGTNSWDHATWHMTPVNVSIGTIVDQGGDAPANHAVTKANMRAFLTATLESGNITHYNPHIVLYWHRDTAGENMTQGHMRAILEATRDAADSLWVAPWGTALKYWKLAHPDETLLGGKSLQ